jgi:hypothetical protein
MLSSLKLYTFIALFAFTLAGPVNLTASTKSVEKDISVEKFYRKMVSVYFNLCR